MHREAEQFTTSASTWRSGLIADRVRGGGTIRETEVQVAIMDHFHRNGMTTYSPPIVGVGPHSGDPHYEPVAGNDAPIGAGRFRLDRPLGQDGPAAVRLQRPDPRRLRRRDGPREVRRHLQDRRRGPRRRHRAGPGRLRRRPAPARLGGRRRLPRGHRRRPATATTSSTGPATTSARRPTATAPTWTTSRPTRSGSSCRGPASRSSPASIFQEFGVRSEVNVFVDGDGKVHVTGGLQKEVLPILAG